MDRYTAELGVVLVAAVLLVTEVVGPALAGLHPAFRTPATELTNPDAPLFSWQYTTHYLAPRFWLLVGLPAAFGFGWAYLRRDVLREQYAPEIRQFQSERRRKR